MRIAVIADTHDRLPESLLPRLSGADAIWHLGDVCRPETLEPLLVLARPVVIVRGNNDANLKWPLYSKQTLGLHRCFLIHIPPRSMPQDCDLLLHGHTHVPRDEMLGPVRVLNPGCVTRPNRGAPRSYAWLTLREDGSLDWQVELI